MADTEVVEEKKRAPAKSTGSRGRKPGMTKAERDARDTVIMRLFLAGWSWREIGAHPKVQLHNTMVGKVIEKRMKEDSGNLAALSDKAFAMHVQRLEHLIRAAWPKALDGDLKAIETCRRLVEQQGRLYDLEEEGRVPSMPPLEGPEDGDEAVTDLDRWRQRRGATG